MEAGLALPRLPMQYTFSGIAVYRATFFAGCIDGVFPLKPLAAALDGREALFRGAVHRRVGGRWHAGAAAGFEC